MQRYLQRAGYLLGEPEAGDCLHGLRADTCATCLGQTGQTFIPPAQRQGSSSRTSGTSTHNLAYDHAIDPSEARYHNEPWTQAEDEAVMADEYLPVLAERLGRTVQAVMSRRSVLISQARRLVSA